VARKNSRRGVISEESVRGQEAENRTISTDSVHTLDDAGSRGEPPDTVGGVLSEAEAEQLEREAESHGLHSSVYRASDSDERILPFRTAREVAEQTPAETRWTVRGYAGPGLITELDGKIKSAGKTTWLSHMVRTGLNGEPFMGRPTTRTPVVWLTEQTPPSFRKVLERSGLTEQDDLFVLHWHDTIGEDWPDVARAAVEKAKEVGAELLIVDTLGQFAGLRGDYENNAGDALKAMEPLQEAAAEGLAVVFTRHERKSGGEVGESGRGSSAIGGAADIILSLRRPEGNTRRTVRIIDSLSRFDETPVKLVVELTEHGYRAHGNATAFAEQEAIKAIVDLLPTQAENAIITDDVLDRLAEQNIKRTTGTTALKKLAEAGTIQRTDEAKKGSPYRYWKPTPEGGGRTEVHSSATPTSIADERNNESTDPVSLAEEEDQHLGETEYKADAEILSPSEVFQITREHFAAHG
jgi:hypothetical protein